MSSSSSSGGHRFPLQALCALGVLSVVAFQCYKNQGAGFVSGVADNIRFSDRLAVLNEYAVPMLFVISSFVLYLPIVRTTLSGETGMSGRDMLLRRCARLLPLYMVVVVLMWGINNPKLPGDWQDLLMHLTMTHVYSEKYIFWTDGPAWALAVEFHFYVLLTLATWPISQACRNARRTVRLAVLLILPVLLIEGGLSWLLFAMGRFSADNWPIWYGPLAQAPIYGVAMLLAVVVGAGGHLRHSMARYAFIGTGLGMLAWSITQNPSYVVSPAQKLWPVYYGVASVLIISGIVMSAKETPRLLTWEPLVALGAWSYGIFLLHEPILRLARPIGVLPSQQGGQWDWLLTALLVSTLATGLAWLSYEHLEQNGRRVLGMFETGPRAREYYPHLVEYGRHTVRPDTLPGARRAQ